MRGCLRIVFRILGSLSMVGTMYCFTFWNGNLGLQEAADRQGDHELAAGFADNTTEAFQAGLVFGGLTLALDRVFPCSTQVYLASAPTGSLSIL